MLKRLALSILICSAAAFGQGAPSQSNYPASVSSASGAPSGNCYAINSFYVNTSNGNLYTCPTVGSSWTLVSGSGSGTVNANSGSAGAVTTYAAAGGSTTVGPDAGMNSNGTGTLTLGGAGLGTGGLTLKGNTSGSGSIICTTATCLSMTANVALVDAAGITSGKFIAGGTTFTTNAGCGEGTLTGGASAGKIVTSGSTSCTDIITIGGSLTATNGWQCSFTDLTTSADAANPHQTATSTNTVTWVSGTIVSGDTIQFSCIGY